MPLNIREKFQNTSILVIGDFMVDEYVRGIVERISPEAPVPVVQEIERKTMPGGAGNVVRNLKALGARVLLVGTVGQDAAADSLNGMFDRMNIDPANRFLIALPDRPTTRKIRILAGNQQVCRLDREVGGPMSADIEQSLLNTVRENIGRVGAVIISDYEKGVVTPELIRGTVELAGQNGVFIAVDPQVSHFHYYRQVDVLTPNHHEAGRFINRTLKGDREIEEGGFEILDRLDASMLIITRGEKGMTLFEKRDRRHRHFPTMAREVFDVTGAGDTVISIFTLAMAAGVATEEAVELCNRGAGVVVGKLGSAVVTPDELF